MHYSSIDNLCIPSISSHCDEKCGSEIHLPPSIPMYDGHIHLNQNLHKIESDLLSARLLPPAREYHFINNNHKPNDWLVSNPSPFSSHVHIYHTIGIHPKYFTPESIYKSLNDLSGHLETSHLYLNTKKRIFAVGEFGLDETAATSLDYQLFLLEKQIDLAIHFHLPIILHCRGFYYFRTLFDCLVNRIPDRSIPIHWHCINSNSDLNIIDLFLNQFPNSFIGLNGSLTYENPRIFKNWLKDRSPFLPERLILETDYPYLMPRNLHGTYDPSCAILGTILYLQKMMGNHQYNLIYLLHSSNSNIKTMYSL